MKHFLGIALVILVFCSPVFAMDQYVSTEGDDENDGLTPGTAVLHASVAIGHAGAEESTIYFDAGVHTSFALNAAATAYHLHFVGAGRAGTTIEASAANGRFPLNGAGGADILEFQDLAIVNKDLAPGNDLFYLPTITMIGDLSFSFLRCDVNTQAVGQTNGVGFIFLPNDSGGARTLTIEDCVITCNQGYWGIRTSGGGGANPRAVITLTNSTFNFVGMRFCNSGNGAKAYPITLTVTGCHFTGAVGDGHLNLNYTHGVLTEPNLLTVTDCDFDGATIGVNFGYEASWNGTVSDCTFNTSTGFFHNPTQGLFGSTAGYTISDCTITNAVEIGNLGSHVRYTFERCTMNGMLFNDANSTPGDHGPETISINESTLGATGTNPVIRTDGEGDTLAISRSTLRAATPAFDNILVSVIGTVPLAALNLQNCVLEGGSNAVSAVGAIPDVKVQHCTIVAMEPSTHLIGVNLAAAATAAVQNSIIVGYNTAMANVDTDTTNYTGPDPEFVNPLPFARPAEAGVSDYQLMGTSPCVETGTDLGYIVDILGNSRPNPPGSAPDIGAYEHGPLGPTPTPPLPTTGVEDWSSFK